MSLRPSVPPFSRHSVPPPPHPVHPSSVPSSLRPPSLRPSMQPCPPTCPPASPPARQPASPPAPPTARSHTHPPARSPARPPARPPVNKFALTVISFTVVTCVSVSESRCARSVLSRPTTYWLRRNSCSRRYSCSDEKVVRARLGRSRSSALGNTSSFSCPLESVGVERMRV